MRNVVIAVIVLVLLGAVGYIGAGPFRVMGAMRAAIVRQQPDELAKYVDFPALQKSLKEELMTAFKAQAPGDSGDLAGGLLEALVGPMVEAIVSPQGLSAVLGGEKPVPVAAGGDTPPPARPFADADWKFEGPNRFAILIPDKNKDDLKIEAILVRSGVDWKLAEIRLPPEMLSPSAGTAPDSGPEQPFWQTGYESSSGGGEASSYVENATLNVQAGDAWDTLTLGCAHGSQALSAKVGFGSINTIGEDFGNDAPVQVQVGIDATAAASQAWKPAYHAVELADAKAFIDLLLPATTLSVSVPDGAAVRKATFPLKGIGDAWADLQKRCAGPVPAEG